MTRATRARPRGRPTSKRSPSTPGAVGSRLRRGHRRLRRRARPLRNSRRQLRRRLRPLRKSERRLRRRSRPFREGRRRLRRRSRPFRKGRRRLRRRSRPIPKRSTPTSAKVAPRSEKVDADFGEGRRPFRKGRRRLRRRSRPTLPKSHDAADLGEGTPRSEKVGVNCKAKVGPVSEKVGAELRRRVALPSPKRSAPDLCRRRSRPSPERSAPTSAKVAVPFRKGRRRLRSKRSTPTPGRSASLLWRSGRLPLRSESAPTSEGPASPRRNGRFLCRSGRAPRRRTVAAEHRSRSVRSPGSDRRFLAGTVATLAERHPVLDEDARRLARPGDPAPSRQERDRCALPDRHPGGSLRLLALCPGPGDKMKKWFDPGVSGRALRGVPTIREGRERRPRPGGEGRWASEKDRPESRKEDVLMPKKATAKPVDRASPTIKKATVTDAQKVDVAHSTTASMAKSPLWATSSDVQTAAKAWNLSADDIDSNAKVITDLRNQLAAAESKQQGQPAQLPGVQAPGAEHRLARLCRFGRRREGVQPRRDLTRTAASVLSRRSRGSPRRRGRRSARPRRRGFGVSRGTGSSFSTRPARRIRRRTRRPSPVRRPSTRSAARGRPGPACTSGSRRSIRSRPPGRARGARGSPRR